MSQQLPPGQDDEEIQALALLVADNLGKGESVATIIKQLVENGWEFEDAQSFVRSIQRQMEEPQSSGGGEGYGWLIWIGGILGINLLSYLLNWNFWIW